VASGQQTEQLFGLYAGPTRKQTKKNQAEAWFLF
jgi:hypothetical protein